MCGEPQQDQLDPGVETGSAHHLEVPQLVCCSGADSVGEVLFVALHATPQQADTAAKMSMSGRAAVRTEL